MKIEQIKALAKEIHEGNVKCGFWEGERSLSEVLMLIRTEMSEAVEADRKGRLCSLGINEDSEHSRIDTYKHLNIDAEFSTTLFKGYIKDTVEDELADTVICILDAGVAGLFNEKHFIDSLEFSRDNLGFINRHYESLIDFAEFWNYHFPFSEDFPPSDLSDSLVQVLAFCEQNDIPIWWHVKEKLKYNDARPYKHGKKY